MFFAKAKSSKQGEIYIYEDIGDGWFGGLSAKRFTEDVKAMGAVETIDIYLNSPGGSVFEGLTIYNVLRRHAAKKTVHIDGIAASIASIIALSGDVINIAANGMFMIHNAWGFGVGNSTDLRKAADDLEKVNDTLINTYLARTKNDDKQIRAWMDAETWFDAKEALAHGFVTNITEERQISAAYPLLGKFKNTPEALKCQALASKSLLARINMRADKLARTSPAK